MSRYSIILCAICLFAIKTYSQSTIQKFQEAKFILTDSSVRTTKIDVPLLLLENNLHFEQVPEKPWSLRDTDRILIDSSEYFVKRIQNLNDSIKVIEQVIKGKINFFRSPRISPNEELFAEKDGVLYELRITRRYIDGRSFDVREFTSYLKLFMEDCDAIDKSKLVNDLGFSFSAISRMISKYNQNCGWQKTKDIQKDLKPKVTLSLSAGTAFARLPLSYISSGRRFRGKTSLLGVFVGPTIGLEFRKFKDTNVSFNIAFEKLSGDAIATDGVVKHLYDYDIVLMKHFFNASISVKQSESMNIYMGSGLIATYQLKNKTQFINYPNSYGHLSEKDKFNLSPHGFIHYDFLNNNIGIRYQLIALSIYMKNIELFGFDHRISVYYNFKK